MSDPAAKGEYGNANPWTIAILVAVATFMEVLDTTIANVALRYISGGLAVSSDEASWVITTYLVANSIVLCASGWIAQMFGRKSFFLMCIALFTLSSLLCGLAWNLQALLIFRVMQGLAGGGMTPVAQSILAAAFPPAKRSQGFALYGIAVVVAPAVGPTLGGWLSDNLSWHWCFLINVPVGLISAVLIYLIIPVRRKSRRNVSGSGRDELRHRRLPADCDIPRLPRGGHSPRKMAQLSLRFLLRGYHRLPYKQADFLAGWSCSPHVLMNRSAERRCGLNAARPALKYSYTVSYSRSHFEKSGYLTRLAMTGPTAIPAQLGRLVSHPLWLAIPGNSLARL